MTLDLNALQNLTDAQQTQVIEYLDDQLRGMKAADHPNKDLLCGLETVLQTLGAEGYEFT